MVKRRCGTACRVAVVARLGTKRRGKGVQANARLAEAAAAVQEAVRAEARAARVQNAAEAHTAHNTAIALAAGAPLLSLLLGFLISRSITRPLGGAVSFAQLVAGGNLGAELAVRGRDEIGRLADALRVMVDTLKAKIAEAEDKSEQAARGGRGLILTQFVL